MNPEEHPTSNIQTPNIEWQRDSSLTSAFGVRCLTCDVLSRFSGFERANFHFVEISPHRME